MTSRATSVTFAALLATGALALAACGGGSTSTETTSAAPAPAPTESPIGGGSAECTTEALEKATEEAASAQGIDLINTEDYDCEDGWAIVFGITKSGDIQQTTAFLFQAEGPYWVTKDIGSICSGGPDDGIPASIKDQACALR